MSLIPFVLEQIASNNGRAYRCIETLKELFDVGKELGGLNTEVASKIRETILLAKEPVVIRLDEPTYDSNGKVKTKGKIFIAFFGGKMPYPNPEDQIAKFTGTVPAKPKWSIAIKQELFVEIMKTFKVDTPFEDIFAYDESQEIEYIFKKGKHSKEEWDRLVVQIPRVIKQMGYTIKE